MKPELYSVMHVLSAIFLVAFTFQAFAAPVEVNRKRLVITTGVLGLLVFVAGFGLFSIGEFDSVGWVMIKMVCAMVLTGLTPMALKRPERAGRLLPVAIFVVVVAIVMVYFKPF